MDTKLITKIIDKFLNGDCSDEEFAYLLYWYESFDENTPLTLDDEEKQLLKLKILNRIRKNIPELDQDEISDVPSERPRIRVVARWVKFALAAAVIVLVAWSGFRYFPNMFDHATIKKGKNSKLITLNNMSNRIHHVVLPDSSDVWISPNSEIAYPEKFIGYTRRIELKGEAFFDVNKDASHPFIVTSGNLVARVLGTSFLLKAYVGKPVEVTVLTGKIAVSSKGKSDNITLYSQQKAVLGVDGEVLKQTVSEKAVVQRWQKANLSFDNASFDRVVKALNKKFDISIHCRQPEIDNYKLNADFNNQNLTDILEMLEKSLNIHYEMENDSVINFYIN